MSRKSVQADEVMDEEQETVEARTFYSWVERLPSSETIHISGGARSKDSNGNIMSMGYKEVRFNAGILHTDDPEVIAVILSLIKRGAHISEDKEVYLAQVLPAERMSERNRQQIVAMQRESLSKSTEINRLKDLLKKKGVDPASGKEKEVAETAA